MSRKAGSEEFKEELSRARQNEQAREALLTNPEAREKRLSGVEFIDGFENFDGYDDKNVSQALQGKSWGDDDQRRYDQMMMGNDFDGDVVSDPITNPEPDPVEQAPVYMMPAPAPIVSNNEVTFAPPGTAPGVDDVQQIAQDNDIISPVYGSNSQVTNVLDNSINRSGPSRITTDWLQKYNLID